MSKGFEDWSLDDVKRHNLRILMASKGKNTSKEIKPQISQSRNKYGNVKVEVDGVKYDSKKEAKRSAELETQQKLGIISNLERQVKFVLQPSFKFMGHTIREIAYVADFVYMENGNKVVEDVKSPITRKNPIYKLKKKMMMYVHGIEVKEV